MYDVLLWVESHRVVRIEAVPGVTDGGGNKAHANSNLWPDKPQLVGDGKRVGTAPS